MEKNLQRFSIVDYCSQLEQLLWNNGVSKKSENLYTSHWFTPASNQICIYKNHFQPRYVKNPLWDPLTEDVFSTLIFLTNNADIFTSIVFMM
jgi:hypothetical protein